MPSRQTGAAPLLLFLSFVLFASPAAADPFGDFRGLWISRFEYNEDSVADIQNRINRAADMGITDVIWQVRAKSDAYYNSNFEAPAEDWNGIVDPLQVALDTAHSRGMELHAWLNTMPIWRDTPQPTDPNHIFFNEDPSFRVTDINGNVEQLVGGQSSFTGNTYARVNHVLPEVQTHINDVVNDIATNYDVDGIHLDYIRWLGPNGGSSEGFRPDWDFLPHDPVSHQLYLDETGQNGADGSTFAKRESYRDWVQGKITDLVTSVKATVDAAEISEGRDIELSAAVWNNPTTAERDYMQDYRTWMQQDLLDITIPMVYLRDSNSNLLDGFLDDIFAQSTNGQVSIGLGTYLHDNANGGVPETLSQINEVYNDGRADSLTFFSYASLLDGSSLSNQRRQAVVDWYDALDPDADPPAGHQLAEGANLLGGFDLTGDEGYFASSITAGGQTTISASSAADQTRDESHTGAGSQRLAIDGDDNWTLRHLAGGADPRFNEPLSPTGSVGFWLKTSDPGLTVRIAVDDANDPNSADRGVEKEVIADGEWRLYEWDLEDDSQWEGWVLGDGVVTGPTFTLDSIFLFGSGDATVFLDTVAHNPNGSLVAPRLPGDFNRDGVVDGADYTVWRDTLLSAVDLRADGNGDGVVNDDDYGVWIANYGASLASDAVAAPEPSTAALLGLTAISAFPRFRLRRLPSGSLRSSGRFAPAQRYGHRCTQLSARIND